MLLIFIINLIINLSSVGFHLETLLKLLVHLGFSFKPLLIIIPNIQYKPHQHFIIHIGKSLQKLNEPHLSSRKWGIYYR